MLECDSRRGHDWHSAGASARDVGRRGANAIASRAGSQIYFRAGKPRHAEAWQVSRHFFTISADLLPNGLICRSFLAHPQSAAELAQQIAERGVLGFQGDQAAGIGARLHEVAGPGEQRHQAVEEVAVVGRLSPVSTYGSDLRL